MVCSCKREVVLKQSKKLDISTSARMTCFFFTGQRTFHSLLNGTLFLKDPESFLLLGLLKLFPLTLLFSFSSAKLVSTRCCFDEDVIFDYGEKREKKTLKRETGRSYREYPAGSGRVGRLVEHVYMRPEVNSNRFEISSRFENSFGLHGDFSAATFQTIIRSYCTCANDNF